MELILEHISKSYGTKQALSDVSLKLEPGVIGLLGPNGAGKSTLMRLLATIEKPTQGTMMWNGVDIVKNPARLRANLGYLPQEFGVYPHMNPVEFLEYIAAMKGIHSAKKRILELLDILNLTDARKRPIGGFSGGMKQRVGIAQSLLNDPSLLIVDEPTVGLDPEERIRFRNILSAFASNRIIILSTHIVSDIETIAPRIAVMFQGKLLKVSQPETWIQSVENKVWNVIVSTAEFQELQKTYKISSSMHRRDGVHARVLSDYPPTVQATKLPPSLEDAYLYTTSTLGVTS